MSVKDDNELTGRAFLNTSTPLQGGQRSALIRVWVGGGGGNCGGTWLDSKPLIQAPAGAASSPFLLANISGPVGFLFFIISILFMFLLKTVKDGLSLIASQAS